MKQTAERREVDRSHVRRDEEPEGALWRHVIWQALQDATTPLTNSQMKKPSVILDRQRAREWLLGNSERFRMACEFAEVQIEQVRALARRLIKQADAKQRVVLNDIKATAMNALANQQQQMAAELLTSAMPGVVNSFQMEGRDRRSSAARDGEKIEFSSQSNNLTQNQTISAETCGEMATVKQKP